MEPAFIENKTFEKINFTDKPLKKGEYENCNFNFCDFSNTDFTDILFIECTFNNCNLSLVNLNNTAFRDCMFMECKMLGLRFDTCNKYGLLFKFESCTLNHSTFYRTKLKNTGFSNSQLIESDFSGSDLTGSVFDNCDLSGATFEDTILEKVDFRSAYNYSFDPEVNKIKKAKFSLSGIAGLLTKYDIEIE